MKMSLQENTNSMITKGSKLLLIVVALCTSYITNAQFFPVQTTTQLIPPYSVYLSDYATGGNEKLRVILLQRDLTQPSYQLRLVMTVELNGQVIMRTSRAYTPAPINLNPGIPTVISGAELAPYVDSRNIDFVGYSRDQYERTKALPEGSYQITFTAYDYRRQDVQVSNAGISFYYLSKNEPPLINFPACGTKIPMRVPQQIIFSWLSRNTSSPNSAADTEYELSLYETRPEGRNPNDVVLSTQPVFRITVDLPQYIYGPADPLLLDNMKYVWCVRAIDRNGKDAFRNNGYSEVCTFTYGGTDPNFDLGVVKNLQAEGETERKGRIWWDMGEYDGYVASYRKTGEGYEWFTSTVTTDELKQAGKTQGEVKLFDLEPDTEYETRVQPKKSGFLGAYTDIIKFRTKPHVVAQCGVNPNLPQADLTKPMRSGIKGMLIQVDDIEIQLMDVLHLGDGWYKGTGRTSIPYFGGAVFAVVFDRLYIDENRVAGLGRVDFVTQGVAGLVEQQNTNLVIAKKDLLQKENREEWKDVIFFENVFVYDDIVISNITVDASGAISIIDNVGNVTPNDAITEIMKVTPEKAIIIQDKNGDQYVVQKDGANTKVTKVEGGGLAPGPGGTMLDEQTIKNLYKMILISLNKYKTAISQYQAANNPPKGKGGGDRVRDWGLLKYLADLPVCLEEHKDRLDEIGKNVNVWADSSEVASHDFATRISPSITVITQDKVDEVVCTEIVEVDVLENISTNLTVLVNSDTLKTANTVFIVTSQSLKIDSKYNVVNGGEVNFKITIKPEGAGTDILHPSSDWKKVQNNESWVLDLTTVQEGMYTLSYKIGTTVTSIDFYIRTLVHDYACSVCGRNLKLTATDLDNIFPSSPIVANDPNVLTYFNEALKKGGFTTCHRQAHFFSQVFEESGGLKAKVEGTAYPLKRIFEVYKGNANTKDVFYKQSFWDDKVYLEYASNNLYETSSDTTIKKYEGKDYLTFKWNKTTTTDTIRFPTAFTEKKPADFKKTTLTEAQKSANGEKLFNLVYANKNGNGNVASGDGFKFRGRGAIQLTGRTTYREVSNKSNSVFGTTYNWENDSTPLENDNKAIIYSVTGFFLWKFGDIKKLDTKDVTYVTQKVNGGTTGLSTRLSKFNSYLIGRLDNCKIKK